MDNEVDKYHFYEWIKELFNKDEYQRTGKRPWDDKPLPVIPKQESTIKNEEDQWRNQDQGLYYKNTFDQVNNYYYPEYKGPSESEIELMLPC